MGDALPLLELWYSAAREPIGLIVPCTAPEALKQKLYQARAKAADPQLKGLMILTSPANPEGEIWIAHRHVTLEGETDV